MTSSAPRLPPGSPEPENEVRLTFVEHLRELRVRLLHALSGVGAGMAVVGWFVPRIRSWLLAPVLAALPEGDQTIKFTGALDPFMNSLRIMLVGGIFLSAPWVLWQLWLFIAPGLYKREKRMVFPFLFFGTLLFYAGAAFCYWVVMPQAFPAMLSFAADPILQPMLTLDAQYSLVLGMILGFGIVFELPVVIAFLAMIGLVTPQFLAKYRRHAMIANVALAAIITPTGDPINLAIMAVPMIVFYEIGILLARILGKRPAQAGTGAP
ncbi:MAG TPA: twin-arginine translocase subunit TatC [Anaeromyxobacter sp.]|nr:twin-arginine translocase subunit TatC [Anaeromyxobacter sp.]